MLLKSMVPKMESGYDSIAQIVADNALPYYLRAKAIIIYEKASNEFDSSRKPALELSVDDFLEHLEQRDRCAMAQVNRSLRA